MPLPARASDLSPYEMLLSVAALGSMGRAAKEHGVSQAAVSSRLKTLEAALGVRLFERSARGTRLTEAGSLVADWARPAVRAAAALDEGAAALRGKGGSRLRISASATAAEHLLPGWLVGLRTQRPDVQVALELHGSASTAADVTSGFADVGFVEGAELPEGLEGCVVAHDALVLVVPADHPWAQRRSITPALLASTPLVAREPGSGTRTFLESALDDVGCEPAAPIAELPSTTALKSTTRSGLAPSVLSSLAVRDELAAGTLVAVPVRGLPLRRAIRAVWPAGTRLDGPARDLVRLALHQTAEPRPLRAGLRGGQFP